MTNGWTKFDEDRSEALENVQRSLTVDLIMTPRAHLRTCQPDETAARVQQKSEGQFSFLPVVDEAGQFLGLYDAHRWFNADPPNELICGDFEHFSEAIVIGADASIIDYVQVAHERPARLVVSGDRVQGLVTPSDLEQLPVRSALFTLMTSLEMDMAQRIESEWPSTNSTDWTDFLSGNQRNNVEGNITKAKCNDNFVNEIVCTSLREKAHILFNKGLIKESVSSLEQDIEAIVELRNSLAHADFYAKSLAEAERTCETVELILRIQNELSASMSSEN